MELSNCVKLLLGLSYEATNRHYLHSLRTLEQVSPQVSIEFRFKVFATQL